MSRIVMWNSKATLDNDNDPRKTLMSWIVCEIPRLPSAMIKWYTKSYRWQWQWQWQWYAKKANVAKCNVKFQGYPWQWQWYAEKANVVNLMWNSKATLDNDTLKKLMSWFVCEIPRLPLTMTIYH